MATTSTSSLIPQVLNRHAAKAATQTPPISPTATHIASNAHLQDAPIAVAYGLNGLGPIGAISPGLLAKYHLPRIFLDRGPLVISHILGILATSVPGFAGIPCAEAERLVVTALESCRSSEGEHGGGLNGNVIFEQVGRGRWDARLREEVSRESQTKRQKSENFQQAGHSHPSGSVPDLSLSHRNIDFDSGEVTEEEDWQNIGAGTLRDRSCYPSGWVPALPFSQHKVECDAGELTEEEDWRDIGAEALRNGSHLSRSAAAGARLRKSSYSYPSPYQQDPKAQEGERGPTTKMMPISSSTNIRPTSGDRSSNNNPDTNHTSTEYLLQEREAIEALVKTSSV